LGDGGEIAQAGPFVSMEIDETAPPAVDALVDAIMQSYGQLA
jgi:hypothetical protein